MSAADVPKAELHVHLEGTATPQLVARLAQRNGIEVPRGLVSDRGHFVYDGFLDFLGAYDRAASVIRTAEDFRDVTHEYLRRCAREGAVYVELIASPAHAHSVGLTDADHWAAIARGIDDARAESGIEARVLASIVRNFGQDAAERVVAGLEREAHPYVVGFNMAGDEENFPAADFAWAFGRAHALGLGCSVHAGEWAGPESIRAALELPGITRISHGVRAVEDPALVSELADRGIVLEVCPTSNVVLGVFPTYEAHPLRALHEAGVTVTLGSDDPPYFATTIGHEYEVAQEEFGFDDDCLRAITLSAVEASFADDLARRSIQDRLREG